MNRNLFQLAFSWPLLLLRRVFRDTHVSKRHALLAALLAPVFWVTFLVGGLGNGVGLAVLVAFVGAPVFAWFVALSLTRL